MEAVVKCPICKEVNLAMSDRQGVEIDYCPECRGVWLDRGELDKIIERAVADSGPSAPGQGERGAQHRSSESRGRDYPRKKKRESFLGELFDF